MRLVNTRLLLEPESLREAVQRELLAALEGYTKKK